MKRSYLAITIGLVMIAATGGFIALRWLRERRAEQLHFERQETELVVTNLAGAPASLFKAGNDLQGATQLSAFDGQRMWLPPGNYFLKVDLPSGSAFYPVPIAGYRSGLDNKGSFVATVRQPPQASPPRPSAGSPEFAYLPSGNFLLGDRLNKRAPHHVWLPAYFMGAFETTNAEFKEFLNDPRGYADDANWTAAGSEWKAANKTKTSASLSQAEAGHKRFGQADQPVTQVTWFEAAAYCKWLTKKLGGGRWLFLLPSEAEWEKAARGPDGFDYALGQTISDDQVQLYNWKKNPDAPVTVVGVGDSRAAYQPNRYGLYHLSGNVAEWTSSAARPYNRNRPYDEAERNREDLTGLRVVRGGSWYSASIALLYLAYRDSFQPEISHHDLGFRIVARPLP
jgi:formylglycine-generating enzyme required for sulfatase activity